MVLARLSERFNLTEDSLSRHRASHIEGEITFKAGVDPQELLVSLVLNKQNAELAFQQAQGSKEQLEALREVRQSTEAIAKLTGAYKATDSRHLLPFWSKMRATIIKSLAPYPEAREAVLRALEEELSASAE